MLTKYNTSSFRRTKLLVVALLLLAMAGVVHATEEFTSEMSATVVKADFSNTNTQLETTDDGYQLMIDLQNTGTLDAEDVEVKLLFPKELRAEETHVIGEVEEEFQETERLMIWQIPSIEIQAHERWQIEFEQQQFMAKPPVFQVSVTSPVSVPVTRQVQANIHSQKNAEIATPVDYLKSFVNVQVEQLMGWFERLWQKWFG